MVRPAAVAMIVLVGSVLLVSTDSSPAAAQETDPAPTTLPQLPEGAGRIVQEPDSGRPAEDPGDRGGWMQTLVFLLIVAAVGTVGLLAWRDSVKRRRSQ